MDPTTAVSCAMHSLAQGTSTMMVLASAARDARRNNAVALRAWLERQRDGAHGDHDAPSCILAAQPSGSITKGNSTAASLS
jgi:hypothetical protein